MKIKKYKKKMNGSIIKEKIDSEIENFIYKNWSFFDKKDHYDYS